MEAVSDEFMQETYEIFKAVYDGDATACYSLGEYYAVVDETKQSHRRSSRIVEVALDATVEIDCCACDLRGENQRNQQVHESGPDTGTTQS